MIFKFKINCKIFVLINVKFYIYTILKNNNIYNYTLIVNIVVNQQKEKKIQILMDIVLLNVFHNVKNDLL